LQNIVTIKNYLLFIKIIPVMVNLSLLQFSVPHDPSEIILICWFGAQESFICIIKGKNGCSAEYPCEKL